MSPRAAWRLESLGFERVYDYVAGKMDWIAFDLPWERKEDYPTVAALARRDVPTCGLDAPIDVVTDIVRQRGICVVVTDKGVVLGRIRSKDLDGGGRTAEDVMEPGPTTYRPYQAAHDALHRMHEAGTETLLVTRADGSLIGMFYAEDGARAFSGRKARRNETLRG